MSSETIPSQLLYEIECGQRAVRAANFSVDGVYALTCGSDKTLKLWNPHKALHIKTYQGHYDDVMDAKGSCDNSQIASCSKDKSVVLWDVITGKILRKYRGHAAPVNCLALNEDSSVIVSGSIDTSVKIWDCRSNNRNAIQVLDDAKDSVTSIKVTAHQIITGSADCKVRTYDLRQAEAVTDNIGAVVASVDVSSDDKCLLVGTMDNSIKLFDKDTGQMLNEYLGHKASEFRISSRVGLKDQVIISGSEDGMVYCWELVEAAIVAGLKHDNVSTVHSVSTHPTNARLLTAAATKMFLWGSDKDDNDT